jgi:hypothetical protein
VTRGFEPCCEHPPAGVPWSNPLIHSHRQSELAPDLTVPIGELPRAAFACGLTTPVENPFGRGYSRQARGDKPVAHQSAQDTVGVPPPNGMRAILADSQRQGLHDGPEGLASRVPPQPLCGRLAIPQDRPVVQLQVWPGVIDREARFRQSRRPNPAGARDGLSPKLWSALLFIRELEPPAWHNVFKLHSRHEQALPCDDDINRPNDPRVMAGPKV